MLSTALMAAITDLLLLLAVSKFCGEKPRWQRCILAAFLQGCYAALCFVLPLGSWYVRLFSRGILCLVAFGLGRDFWRKTLLLISLTVMLESMAGGEKQILPAVLSGIAALLLTLPGRRLLPVRLRYGDKQIDITALQDTGNTLRDPITGRQVLVVGADVAEYLIGVSPHQLSSPLESIRSLPGSRLIPFRTVSGRGFLLAMQLTDIHIGTFRGSALVAFAPEVIGNGEYQALTGGNL